MSDSKLPEKEGVPETPKIKILHVDDEFLIFRALQRMLRQMGRNDKMEIALESASSVDEAIALIQNGLRPDVILSDMMMPEKTGMDFLEWLKQEHPALVDRFCFISGGAKGSDLEDFLESMRAKGRMVDKPFEAEDIRNAIRLILGVK